MHRLSHRLPGQSSSDHLTPFHVTQSHRPRASVSESATCNCMNCEELVFCGDGDHQHVHTPRSIPQAQSRLRLTEQTTSDPCLVSNKAYLRFKSNTRSKRSLALVKLIRLSVCQESLPGTNQTAQLRRWQWKLTFPCRTEPWDTQPVFKNGARSPYSVCI